MTFDELLSQVQELLQREKRVSYRGLKRRFALDDEYLEDLKEELIGAKRFATDEGGRFLVWTGASSVASSEFQVPISTQSSDVPRLMLHAPRAEAERRQLTVMFCDLVGSTALSAQLDPEELREVVRAYQETCTEVIRRYDGYIAQHLGDGLLVYFGYPVAHEDDAQRAVRTGLEIIQAIRRQGTGTGGQARRKPLQVRIGIHTGLVVIGEIGSSEKREMLALGETPNIAARVQGTANPDEVVISAATYRLITGLFEYEGCGQPELKGVTTPLTLYRVMKESEAQSRFDVAIQAGLTPLVGREEELALLRRRWEQATDGEGQVVLLSGEAGIGKSRLVQELKDHVAQNSAVRIEFRCSPYHQNSAFYPLIEHVQQVLHFAPSDTPQVKLQKLEQTLVRYRFPRSDTVPLLAALLSLPHPKALAPLTLTPQQQKQKTLNALLHWLFEEAERATVYTVWEDLHWADPSTLEFLALCLDQVPTARMLMLVTFRPEFTPPWTARLHISHLVLSRLGRKQTSAIVEQIISGKALPSEVIQQIVSKTDGVPLFVEELTKMVVEATREQVTRDEGQEGKTVGAQHAAPSFQVGIPSTLQDALMARLDQLGTAKEVAQQGAVVGRELTYELLRAISPLTEAALQQELTKLVEAELLYQRGRPPHATYLFKHALVQDTAYQSLLKSRRQQLHQQIARVLEERFPGTKETQPELLAHHYTEAGLTAQAVPYWQRAGERATQHSANVEAVKHLIKGLDLLQILPETPEIIQQELALQLALAIPLQTTKGYAAPEVEKVYARARELCQRVGENPQLFRVLRGLWGVHIQRAELQTARELSEQLLNLAQSVQDTVLLLVAHYSLGCTLFFLGELALSREHLEQGTTFYDLQQHHSLTFLYGGSDSGTACRTLTANTLWLLGYPDQALRGILEALTLAQQLSQPFNLAWTLSFVARLHYLRREAQAVQEWAEAEIALCSEQGFPHWLAVGTILQGWALAEQGKQAEGISLMHQGLTAHRATGSTLDRPYYLAMLADAYGKAGQAEAGLHVVAEALEAADRTEERFYEAELYRLKGTLTLEARGWRLETSPSSSQAPSLKPPASSGVEQEAEGYFLKAIEIARKQQAKSLELRAVMSLSCLWQQQGKQTEAHDMLSEVYNWFTEGFDTKDLQEAKALLEELSH